MNDPLDSHLTAEQLALLNSLSSPAAIQAFLDSLPYSAENTNRPPLRVIQDSTAHCLDGALFGAAALRRIGDPAMVVDLFPDPGMDDDHVLAIYKRNGRYGAVAKSNFSGLRFREAVYHSLQELVMSYFEDYFNVDGVKTLRSYTPPLRLEAFDSQDWTCSEAGTNAIEKRLLTMRRISLFTSAMIASLSPVDSRSYEAGMLGVKREGLYKPKMG